MKKFITIAITACVIFAIIISATATTHAASSSGSYIRVKKATYQKYKKAYNSNKKLKTQNEKLKTENKKLKEELENKDGLNSWIWMCIKSLGLSYKEKVWTTPSEYPSKFMINGAEYTVRRQE